MLLPSLYVRALAEGLQQHGLLPSVREVPPELLAEVFGPREWPSVVDTGLLLVALLGVEHGAAHGLLACADADLAEAPGRLDRVLEVTKAGLSVHLEEGTLVLRSDAGMELRGVLDGATPADALWAALSALDLELAEAGHALSIRALHMPEGLSAALIVPREQLVRAQDGGCVGLGSDGDFGLFEADAGEPWDEAHVREEARTEVALLRSLALVIAAEGAQRSGSPGLARLARAGLLAGLADLHGAWALRQVLSLPSPELPLPARVAQWRGHPLDRDEQRAVQTSAVLLHQTWSGMLGEGK